jgi:hypothetical protein
MIHGGRRAVVQPASTTRSTSIQVEIGPLGMRLRASHQALNHRRKRSSIFSCVLRFGDGGAGYFVRNIPTLAVICG